MEKDCSSLDFYFALRQAAIFILLIYLWDTRKNPLVEHFSELDMSIKENQKGHFG